MKTDKAIVTKNRTWGFFGTIQGNLKLRDSEAGDAYALAGYKIVQMFRVEPEAAVKLLDSPYGRHLADQISDKAAVDQELDKVLSRWRRNITRELSAIEEELAGPPPSLAELLKKLSPERHAEIRAAYFKAAEGLTALRRALQQANAEAGGDSEFLAEFALAARADDLLTRSKLGAHV